MLVTWVSCKNTCVKLSSEKLFEGTYFVPQIFFETLQQLVLTIVQEHFKMSVFGNTSVQGCGGWEPSFVSSKRLQNPSLLFPTLFCNSFSLVKPKSHSPSPMAGRVWFTPLLCSLKKGASAVFNCELFGLWFFIFRRTLANDRFYEKRTFATNF